MVLPMPPRPPKRLVPPTTTAAIEIEQIGVELVLLRAAEMRHAEHAADSRADRRNHHDAAEDQLDVEPGIFRRLAVSPDHVNVAAEAGIGQHQMAGE